MKRRWITIGWALSFIGGMIWTATAARPKNLLILHCDQLTPRVLSCYRPLLPHKIAYLWGERAIIQTPHIDWLAQHGALALRFYAATPLCTPSRASFVSGCYPQNTGAIENNIPMRDDIVTFAEELRRHGYATGYAGKWHLDGTAKPGWSPKRKFGFEENKYMFNRGHWKQLTDTPHGPRVKARNSRGRPSYSVKGADETSYTTDFLTTKTIDFIQRHRNEPFCFMVSYPDPHPPRTVRPPYDHMFDSMPIQQPETAKMTGSHLPSYASVLHTRFNPNQIRGYFGMVKCIDENVGRILNTLRELHLLENTIIVFTADHGDMCGDHGRWNKSIPLDGSAQIPFLLYAPQQVQPNTIIRTALSTVDFKPTILHLLGFSEQRKSEGRNVAALFTGKKPKNKIGDVVFSRNGTLQTQRIWAGAFTGRYKLILSRFDPPCFFDLKEDPYEMQNRIDQPRYRPIIRRLAQALQDYCIQHHEPLFQVPKIRQEFQHLIAGKNPIKPIQ